MHQHAVPVSFWLLLRPAFWVRRRSQEAVHLRTAKYGQHNGQQLGLDRTVAKALLHASLKGVVVVYLWMASLILAQDKRWRRA